MDDNRLRSFHEVNITWIIIFVYMLDAPCVSDRALHLKLILTGPVLAYLLHSFDRRS